MQQVSPRASRSQVSLAFAHIHNALFLGARRRPLELPVGLLQVVRELSSAPPPGKLPSKFLVEFVEKKLKIQQEFPLPFPTFVTLRNFSSQQPIGTLILALIVGFYCWLVVSFHTPVSTYPFFLQAPVPSQIPGRWERQRTALSISERKMEAVTLHFIKVSISVTTTHQEMQFFQHLSLVNNPTEIITTLANSSTTLCASCIFVIVTNMEGTRTTLKEQRFV